MKAAIIRITESLVNCDRPDIQDQIQDIVDDLDIVEWDNFEDTQSLNLLVLQTLMNSIPKEALERTELDKENEADTEQAQERLRYNVGATAANIYECRDYLYVAYFVSLEDLVGKDVIDEETYRGNRINRFGSQITSANVASDMVLVRQDLSYEVQDLNIATSMAPGSMVEYSMVRDLATIFYHRGLVVESDGKCAEYHYIQNPLENVIMVEADYEAHYRSHEYEAFNHQLTVFVDTRFNHSNSEINNKASLLAGSKVYGRVLVSLSRRPDFNENPAYADLTDARFDNLLFLRSRNPESTAAVAKSEKVYMNFDKILELAKSRYSGLPIRSAESLNNVLNEDR